MGYATLLDFVRGNNGKLYLRVDYELDMMSSHIAFLNIDDPNDVPWASVHCDDRVYHYRDAGFEIVKNPEFSWEGYCAPEASAELKAKALAMGPFTLGDVTTPFGAALLKARRLGEDVTREWENWAGVEDASSDSASQPQ